MIREVSINLKNNLRFFIKFILLLTLLFSLISIFVCAVFSYLQSLENQKTQFGSTNYYQLDENVQQSTINEVFSKYQHECFETNSYFISAELKVDNSDYKLFRPMINLIEIGTSSLNSIPKNIQNTYNAYKKDICLFGNLPFNKNEICLSFETCTNIQRTTNFVSISPNEIVGKTISIYFGGKEQNIYSLKVVGVLNYGCCELFDNNNVISQIDNLTSSNNIFTRKINRVYIANFSDIPNINKNIETSNLGSMVSYEGSQYGVYKQLTAFGELASTIFSLIAIPLIIILVFVCLIMLNNFFKTQSRLFIEMQLVGYTTKKLIHYALLELIFCSIITFLFSSATGVLAVYLIKNIFKSMLIDIVVNISSVLYSLVILVFVLSIFITVSLIFVRRNNLKTDIYSRTK